MNRFRRGFSSPGFDQGNKSEHDRAVEVMAGLIRREVHARGDDLAAIDWDKLACAALDEAEYAVDGAPHPKPYQFVLDHRRHRAMQLTGAIMNIVGKFMCEHGSNQGNRDASRALLEMFYAEGVEIVTDHMRAEAGLPKRGESGLTEAELIAIEMHRLHVLAQPISMVFAPDKQETK